MLSYNVPILFTHLFIYLNEETQTVSLTETEEFSLQGHPCPKNNETGQCAKIFLPKGELPDLMWIWT